MKLHKSQLPIIIASLLSLCFFTYLILSWVLLFRDPRAIIGIGNLYPAAKDFLFSMQTILSGYGLNSIPTIIFAAVSVAAVILYLIALKVKFTLKQIILFTVLFQIVTFVSFPILSTDIFSYIFSERVATVHGENIWQVKPATFPDDQFGVLADWKDTTSVYGGIHFLLYLLPSYIGQNDLVTLVILYKLVPALFAAGIFYVLYLVLKEQKKNYLNWALIFVFWNPIFILEIFGSGHNDSMMIFFTLLSYYFFRKKLWFFAGIILALAVQVKLIPIVLFFFCLLSLVKKKKYLGLLSFVAGFVSINTLLFSFMQVNLIEFLQRVAYNGGVYWQSLPTVLLLFQPQLIQVVFVLFLLWLLYFTWQVWKHDIEPVYAYIVVLLVYLLFISTAYWNWYVLWILPLIPLVLDKKLLLTTVGLSITSLFAYPLLWVIYRINTQSVIWPIITYILIFIPPITLNVLYMFRKKDLEVILSKVRLNHLIAEKV